MKLYHYSDKGSLQRVLTEGLRPGSEVDKGEKLGFVMFDSRKSHIAISNRIFYEVEIDPEDPKLRQVNAEWFEYYGTVPPSQILRYANPPADADELVELVQRFGTSSIEYKTAFDFIPVVRIYNFDEAGCELDFDFWGTNPPVFRITVRTPYRSLGHVATVSFRKNDFIDMLEFVGDTQEEALAKALAHLGTHYTVKE